MVKFCFIFKYNVMWFVFGIVEYNFLLYRYLIIICMLEDGLIDNG